jgi:hypothetical protein
MSESIEIVDVPELGRFELRVDRCPVPRIGGEVGRAAGGQQPVGPAVVVGVDRQLELVVRGRVDRAGDVDRDRVDLAGDQRSGEA